MVLSTPDQRLASADRFIVEGPNGARPQVVAKAKKRASAPSPTELVRKINERRDHSGFVALRERQESDENLFNLKAYKAPEGYQSFTSNRPRTGALKIISWLSEARMVFKTSRTNSQEVNKAGNTLEKFLRGTVRVNNERLRTGFKPKLQDYTAWSIGLRGWYAGRAMWNTVDVNGELVGFPEIEPWDPLNIAFDADNNGLSWLARVHQRSAGQINSTFGVEIGTAEDKRDRATCYEYMDKDWWGVFAEDGKEGQWLVEPQAHGVKDDFGRKVVPGYAGYQGVVPFTQSVESGDDTWVNVGESVFGAVRTTIEITNRSMSYWMTLVRRAVKHPYILTSPDGKTTLLSDPYREGGEIRLKKDDKLELAPEMKLLADAAAFMGVTNSEMQQGTVSDIVFGDLKIPLSGNAANILRAGARHQVTHRLDALSDAFKSIGNLMRWQYQSGEFGVVRFFGEGSMNHWFDEEIPPDSLKDSGYLEVEFRNQLGFEDPQRYVTAAQLKQSELAPDDWIASEVMEVEDVEGFQNAIKAQRAISSSPKTLGVDMVRALMSTGDEAAASFIKDEVKRMHKAGLRDDFLQQLQFRIQTRQALQALQQQDPAAALELIESMRQEGVGGFDAAPLQGEGDGPPGIDNAIVSSQDQGLDTGFRVESGQSDNARGEGAPRRSAQDGSVQAQAQRMGLTIAGTPSSARR